ncbi:MULTISPECIES: hypothetical protein [unclassified Halomonas]|uniref:hypothetical protein n=1 Tax=unclassified Halomonas TaxID=2609666 RepID=UPI002076A7A4|nr:MULTISPECIES: hypothetical protein [unclassified Halomonas]
MRKTAALLLTLFSLPALGQTTDQLACFGNNSISMDEQGDNVDVRTYDKIDDAGPEYFLFFDLADKTVTYFWTDTDTQEGTRRETQEVLQRVNEHLYLSKFELGNYRSQSSYLFSPDIDRVMVTELGYFSHHSCEPGSVSDIAARYDIDFSPYRSAQE